MGGGELILSVILQSAAHHRHRHPIMTPSPPLHAPRPRQRRAAQVEKSPDGGRLLIYYPSLCCQVTLLDSSFTRLPSFLPSSPPLLCPHALICLIRESDPCRLPSLSPEGRSALSLVITRWTVIIHFVGGGGVGGSLNRGGIPLRLMQLFCFTRILQARALILKSGCCLLIPSNAPLDC